MPDHVSAKSTKLEKEMGMMAADAWIRPWRFFGLPLVWFGGKRRKELGHQIATALATGRHLENVRMREWLEKTCCE